MPGKVRQKLGSRVVTTPIASGDDGVGKETTTTALTCSIRPYLSRNLYLSLTARPRFHRSLCHCHWRNDWLRARGRGEKAVSTFLQRLVLYIGRNVTTPKFNVDLLGPSCRSLPLHHPCMSLLRAFLDVFSQIARETPR